MKIFAVQELPLTLDHCKSQLRKHFFSSIERTDHSLVFPGLQTVRCEATI